MDLVGIRERAECYERDVLSGDAGLGAMARMVEELAGDVRGLCAALGGALAQDGRTERDGGAGVGGSGEVLVAAIGVVEGELRDSLGSPGAPARAYLRSGERAEAVFEVVGARLTLSVHPAGDYFLYASPRGVAAGSEHLAVLGRMFGDGEATTAVAAGRAAEGRGPSW